jgi:Xaa-Pro aminopeptidase
MLSIERIQEFLPDRDTAALITSEINCRYFSGFAYTDGAVLITRDGAYLLCDFRYIEAAQKHASPAVTVVQFQRLYDTINDIILKKNIKRLMIEEESVTLARLAELKERLNAELLTDVGLSAKIRAVRVIKTADEIALITKAQRIAEKALTELLNFVKPGVTERAMSVELEHLIHVYGGERVAFELITVAGANTSLPHGVPGDYVVRDGDFFTFDIGAVYQGYHSDMTRTYAVGHATDKMREVYDAVYRAHMLAAQKVVAGNTTADVDLAARDYIESKGWGECFGHSTGHGVGLEIHEDPRVYKTDKTVLKDGMVITDEPGIYLPGEFGVRIEDMIVVDGDHSYTLAAMPKELIVL